MIPVVWLLLLQRQESVRRRQDQDGSRPGTPQAATPQPDHRPAPTTPRLAQAGSSGGGQEDEAGGVIAVLDEDDAAVMMMVQEAADGGPYDTTNPGGGTGRRLSNAAAGLVAGAGSLASQSTEALINLITLRWSK